MSLGAGGELGPSSPTNGEQGVGHHGGLRVHRPVSPPRHSYLCGGIMEGPEGPIEHHDAIPVELQWDGLKDTVWHSAGHWCQLGVTVYRQLTEILQASQQPVKVHLGGYQ